MENLNKQMWLSLYLSKLQIKSNEKKSKGMLHINKRNNLLKRYNDCKCLCTDSGVPNFIKATERNERPRRY